MRELSRLSSRSPKPTSIRPVSSLKILKLVGIISNWRNLHCSLPSQVFVDFMGRILKDIILAYFCKLIRSIAVCNQEHQYSFRISIDQREVWWKNHLFLCLCRTPLLLKSMSKPQRAKTPCEPKLQSLDSVAFVDRSAHALMMLACTKYGHTTYARELESCEESWDLALSTSKACLPQPTQPYWP